ncbi:YtxH domain-containing protein [Arcobacter vandammei]|uniref:YtxH domain-containing protein n=1 Tax=Arcobacter vandammei TaxID=2782243 RepID=UPI0018DF0458|nr:YtxH domain-containing protein [Arcobacter vandammei]
MNNQINNQNMNQYDTNINNTRNQNQSGLNFNQNPYINQNVVSNQNQNLAQNSTATQTNTLFNADFIKGALIGAVATYLLTNKNAQENIFKVVEKAKSLVSAGVEEMKERMEDARAAAQAKEQEF